MAKMIPSYIDRTDPRRQGEYMVYDWLASEEIPGVAFYSMPQTTHDVKTMSEVDFLYICEKGMLCIEVKGGQEIYREGMVWYSRNKKGEDIKIADPFWQSHGCMKALQSYIENIYGEKSIESKFSVGCAVVFPECISKCEGDGIIPEIMFDARYELNTFGDFLQRSIKYWTDLFYLKQAKRTIGLNGTQINQMITLLESNFGSVPSMKLQISTAYNQMLQLTEEQFDVMESIADNKRIIVQGVAGTGKSILAIEKARKLSSMHKKVLYLCFNKNMSVYAGEAIRNDENIDVFTFHALANKYIDDEVYSLDVNEVSQLFLANLKDGLVERYDEIIVDEAQDIMSLSAIKCIDKLVQGGIKEGNWIFFLDPNQNIFGSDEQYEEAINFLNGFNPCRFTLTYNCRNTAQIARNTSVLTTTSMTKYMKLSGPKVVTKKYDSVEEVVECLDKDIRNLLMGGTPVKDIIILSPVKKENSVLAFVDKIAGVDIVEVKDYKKKKDFNLNYYTVQAYKGLESQVVFYVDIKGFQDSKNRRINYVAMSRAEIVLHLYYPNHLDAEYKDMMIKGIDILERY